MDEGDKAQLASDIFLMESMRRSNVGAHRDAPSSESETQCIDCGAEIPEERRAAVPGCTRCVRCQQIFERSV